MCRIVYLGIFTQCQYIPFKHANRHRIPHQKSVGHTVCTYIYSAFLLPVLCRTHFRILKENSTRVILICESTSIHLAECRPRPGASITVQRWARVCTLCISPVPIYSQVRRYRSGARSWSSLNANSSFPHYFINL